MKIKIHFLLSLLFLSACGFHPMYGVNKYTPVGVEEHLGQIEIGNIPDREGQFLRNALIDRFYREGRPADPQYLLSLAPVQENRVKLDITRSSDSTRAQLRLSTTMTLTDKQTGKAVLRRTINSIGSYNILSSEFSTRVSEENVRQDTLNDLARQVELQINLYFKRGE